MRKISIKRRNRQRTLRWLLKHKNNKFKQTISKERTRVRRNTSPIPFPPARPQRINPHPTPPQQREVIQAKREREDNRKEQGRERTNPPIGPAERDKEREQETGNKQRERGKQRTRASPPAGPTGRGGEKEKDFFNREGGRKGGEGDPRRGREGNSMGVVTTTHAAATKK